MKLNLKNNKSSVLLAITSCGIAIMLVASIMLQFKSVDESKKAGIESLGEDEIKTQIATYKSKYEEAMQKYNENMNTIQEYKTKMNDSQESSELVDKELEQSRMLLGLTDVTGDGVIITLTDTSSAVYTSENLRYIVNELKYAGAEAISINDNRIINLTDIVTINGLDSYFIVMYGGTNRISSPYVIKAIGDTDYLSSTLNLKNSGVIDIMKSNGLSIKVEQAKNLTIKKYDRTIETNNMKEEE